MISNYVLILTDLDIAPTLDILYQEGVIDQDRYEEIKNKTQNTTKKQGRRVLLDRLLSRSEKDPKYSIFLRAVEETSPHLAKSLKSNTSVS